MAIFVGGRSSPGAELHMTSRQVVWSPGPVSADGPAAAGRLQGDLQHGAETRDTEPVAETRPVEI